MSCVGLWFWRHCGFCGFTMMMVVLMVTGMVMAMTGGNSDGKVLFAVLVDAWCPLT